jgi:glycerol kinase
VGYQSYDLIEAMRRDLHKDHPIVLRADGGMVASEWTMQFLADILDEPVDCSRVEEVTALGAAWLAGWKAGVWPDAEGFAAGRGRQRAFHPGMAEAERRRRLKGWRQALKRTLTGATR